VKRAIARIFESTSRMGEEGAHLENEAAGGVGSENQASAVETGSSPRESPLVKEQGAFHRSPREGHLVKK
jgi:hypothetical protein